MLLLLPETRRVGAAVIPALFRQVPAIATHRTTTLDAMIAATGYTFHSSHSANPNGTKPENERISFGGSTRSNVDGNG